MGVLQLREEGVDLTTSGDAYVTVIASSPAGALFVIGPFPPPLGKHRGAQALNVECA